jgi:hypothetical protein
MRIPSRESFGAGRIARDLLCQASLISLTTSISKAAHPRSLLVTGNGDTGGVEIMTQFGGYLVLSLAVEGGKHQIQCIGACIGSAEQRCGPEAHQSDATGFPAELQPLIIGKSVFQGFGPVTKSVDIMAPCFSCLLLLFGSGHPNC